MKTLIRSFSHNCNTLKNNTFVIALAGYRGSGKTTIANEIYNILTERMTDRTSSVVRLPKPDVLLTSFARRLKETLSTLVGRVDYEKDDIIHECNPSTVRDFLMNFGTEFMRDSFHKDFWIDTFVAEILTYQLVPPKVIIIDDLRFENEYGFIKDVGIGILLNREVVRAPENFHESEVPTRLMIPDQCNVQNDDPPEIVAQRVLEIVSETPYWQTVTSVR